MMAPVIPALNDHEIERLLAAVATAGAQRASFMLLRLPFEVAGLFEEWLRQHYPDRAGRVLNHLRGMRRGQLNDPRFGRRCQGEGAYAAMLSARFAAACRRHGLNTGAVPRLDTTRFLRDPAAPGQRGLFDEI
jgi:DNA repair photolyase